MNIISNWIFLCCMVSIMSCGEKVPKPADNAEIMPFANQLPAMPAVEIERMRLNCTGIDYTFIEHGFSMSIDEREDIVQDFMIIGDVPPQINTQCKLMGMIFYKQGQERFYDAELYFSDQCQYMIFMKDGKQVYANQLSPDGVAQFQGILEYIEEQKKQFRGQ